MWKNIYFHIEIGTSVLLIRQREQYKYDDVILCNLHTDFAYVLNIDTKIHTHTYIQSNGLCKKGMDIRNPFWRFRIWNYCKIVRLKK